MLTLPVGSILIVAAGVTVAGFMMSRQQRVRERDAQMALASNQQMIESLKDVVRHQ